MDNRVISGDPRKVQHAGMVRQPHPPQFVVVLKGVRFAVSDLSQPDPHGSTGIQWPACLRFARQFGSKADANPQLFPELPVEGGLRGFAGLNLSTGKFPHPGELLGGAAPGHQHLGRPGQGIHHSAANYLYQSSHRIILWRIGCRAREGGPVPARP